MRTFILAALVAAFVVVAYAPADARGARPPLPPVFSGGNAGAWLGDGGGGPLFGFDTLMMGGGFYGGVGSGGGGYWWEEPIQGGSGGSGGSRCPGNCWAEAPGGVGPCTPLCDCWQHPNQATGVGTCARVGNKDIGSATDCKNESGSGYAFCKVPE